MNGRRQHSSLKSQSKVQGPFSVSEEKVKNKSCFLKPREDGMTLRAPPKDIIEPHLSKVAQRVMLPRKAGKPVRRACMLSQHHTLECRLATAEECITIGRVHRSDKYASRCVQSKMVCRLPPPLQGPTQNSRAPSVQRSYVLQAQQIGNVPLSPFGQIRLRRKRMCMPLG